MAALAIALLLALLAAGACVGARYIEAGSIERIAREHEAGEARGDESGAEK